MGYPSRRINFSEIDRSLQHSELSIARILKGGARQRVMRNVAWAALQQKRARRKPSEFQFAHEEQLARDALAFMKRETAARGM